MDDLDWRKINMEKKIIDKIDAWSEKCNEEMTCKLLREKLFYK